MASNGGPAFPTMRFRTVILEKFGGCLIEVQNLSLSGSALRWVGWRPVKDLAVLAEAERRDDGKA